MLRGRRGRRCRWALSVLTRSPGDLPHGVCGGSPGTGARVERADVEWLSTPKNRRASREALPRSPLRAIPLRQYGLIALYHKSRRDSSICAHVSGLLRVLAGQFGAGFRACPLWTSIAAGMETLRTGWTGLGRLCRRADIVAITNASLHAKSWPRSLQASCLTALD